MSHQKWCIFEAYTYSSAFNFNILLLSALRKQAIRFGEDYIGKCNKYV